MAIAPDGYIPNSVIRGWMRTLKKPKEPKELDSDEDDDNEDFYIGYYNESYKGLRAQRRAKQNEKRSYVKWDYRPELDAHFAHKDSPEESKTVTGLKDDKDRDKNKDSSRSAGVKGKINGRERLGFGFAFERKWPKGVVNGEEELGKMDTTDKSRTESKKETDIEVVLKEKDTTKQDKTEQNKQSTVKMPHIPKESYNIQTMPANLSNQTLQKQLPALVRNIDRESPTADPPKTNVLPQTISEKSIVQPQKTKTWLSPVESRQSGSGKVQGKEPLV